jgi:hypothetical protein
MKTGSHHEAADNTKKLQLLGFANLRFAVCALFVCPGTADKEGAANRIFSERWPRGAER